MGTESQSRLARGAAVSDLDDRMEQQIARMQVRQREKRIAADREHHDRRERIATACMAGMMTDSSRRVLPQDYAKVAVQYADALIAELDKGVQP
jgi:hypothetical protein